MNRSEKLCKFLGIEPNWVNITCKGLECKNKCNLFVLPSDKCRKIEKGEPCQHIYRYKEIYPDLTKPSNFVKLLEILTSNELEVVFGTCKHKKTNFYCDIYHYETMADTKGLVIDDLQELFCNISDSPINALVSTLLKMFNGDLPIEIINGEMQEDLYCMWEVGICIDYQEVVDKIHEILENVKKQAQATKWDY